MISQVPSQKWNPQLKNRRCDVLLGRDYRTPHGAVTNEGGVTVEYFKSGNSKKLGEKIVPMPFYTLDTPILKSPKIRAKAEG